MTPSTFHTYPDLLLDGGRLAKTVYPFGSIADAVAATLARDPEAVILRASRGLDTVRGLAPGGLG